MKLAHLSRHCRLYLAQGVEAHDDCIQHRKKMGEAVKGFHIPLTAVSTAYFNYFIMVERFYQLTIYRLSEEMCTFAHVI